MQKVSYFNKKQETTPNCGYKSIKISAFNIVKISSLRFLAGREGCGGNKVSSFFWLSF